MTSQHATEGRLMAAAMLFESVGSKVLSLRQILVKLQESIDPNDDVAAEMADAAAALAHATYEKCTAAAAAAKGYQSAGPVLWGLDSVNGDWVRDLRGSNS